MSLEYESELSEYQSELYTELYNTKTLVNAAITCCQEREFRGEYYGIPHNFTQYISNERNEYLSLLTLAFDKIKYIDKLILYIENELTRN